MRCRAALTRSAGRHIEGGRWRITSASSRATATRRDAASGPAVAASSARFRPAVQALDSVAAAARKHKRRGLRDLRHGAAVPSPGIFLYTGALMALLRSVATVGSYTLVSRVFGFIRDILTAAILGAGPVADAFFVAQRLPNLPDTPTIAELP